MRSQLLVVGAFALGMIACSGFRGGAIYDGSTRPSLVAGSDVRELTDLPADYERLGTVRAHCTRYHGAWPPDGAPLSDVDCTEARLIQALRERAAEVGGEALIGRHCGARIIHEGGGSTRYGVTCSSDVARPGQRALGGRPLGPRTDDPDAPAIQEDWRIQVRFADNPRVPPRLPRGRETVREVPNVPVSHVRLGDVVTECGQGCSEKATRAGVLVAASRFGATDVAGVRCARHGDGFLCQGTAAAYEVDPDLHPQAR